MGNGGGLLAIRNAVENASVEPITDAQIVAILRGGEGCGSHLRAVFGDVSLQGLSKAAAAYGIPLRTILGAYRRARDTAAAANGELDRELEAEWWV